MSFDFYSTEAGKSYSKTSKQYTRENALHDNSMFDLDREYYAHQIEDVQYPKGSVVALFDLDTVIFPSASASDQRVIDVSKDGKTKTFNTRTEFKALCKTKGWDYTSFEIKDRLIAEPVEYCLSTLKRAIKNFKEDVGATHAEYYLGGSGNHRLELPLPVQYKSNRKDMIRPTHLKACQDYVVKYLGAKRIKGIECDDLVSIRTIAVNKQDGVKGVLITTDKDALQTFNAEAYVYRQGKEIHLNDTLGTLYLDKSGKVKGTGLKLLIAQTLFLGDSTDEYLPRRHFKTRYGEKSYYKDVNDIKDVKEFLQFSIEKFKSLVGETTEFTDWTGKQQKMTWLELAELYFKCSFMQTKVDDDTTFESILKEYKVEY